MRADAFVHAQGSRYSGGIGARLITEIRYLVDKTDTRGQIGIDRMFGHFRARQVHPNDRGI